MGKWIAVVMVGVLLTGCQYIELSPQSRPQVEDITESGRVARKVAFPAEEYAALEKHGSAVVTGRLFLRTSDGVFPGAKKTISIAPATAYSAEAAEVALAGKAVEPADPRAREYTHYTQTDRQGYFKATGLPSGVFYIAGSVKPPGDSKPRIIINQIKIRDGQTLKVTLSR